VINEIEGYRKTWLEHTMHPTIYGLLLLVAGNWTVRRWYDLMAVLVPSLMTIRLVPGGLKVCEAH